MIAGLFFWLEARFLFRYTARMKRTAIYSLPLVFALSACATVTADHEQAITIATTPADAQCVLSNSGGSWTVEKTPGSVVVPRAFEPLDVLCKKTDIGVARMQLEAKTRGRAYGNILLGGVPALVDASTGAGYEYAPASLSLELKAPTAANK